MQHLWNVLLPWFEEHSEALGAICFVLLSIYRGYRTARLNAEHLERERQRLTRFAFEQVNETQRTLSTAFASEEPQTLADLLSHAERDWSLRSSESDSELDAPDDDNETKPAIPHPHRRTIPPPPRAVPPPRRPRKE